MRQLNWFFLLIMPVIAVLNIAKGIIERDLYYVLLGLLLLVTAFSLIRLQRTNK